MKLKIEKLAKKVSQLNVSFIHDEVHEFDFMYIIFMILISCDIIFHGSFYHLSVTISLSLFNSTFSRNFPTFPRYLSHHLK